MRSNQVRFQAHPIDLRWDITLEDSTKDLSEENKDHLEDQALFSSTPEIAARERKRKRDVVHRRGTREGKIG